MFMNWLQRILYGRYGNDILNVCLLGFSIVLMVVLRIVAVFTGIIWLPVFSYLPFLACMFRMFSRNTSRRFAENQKFLAFFTRVRNLFPGKHRSSFGSAYGYANPYQNGYSRPAPAKVKKEKGYKYYRCPDCRVQLRVPKGKGKICITCPKCHTEFIKKT